MIDRRDPQATRAAILQSGFWEIYRHGFRATSVDQLLRETGVTKGAFYHHFASKTELGYAVVDEIFTDWIDRHWVQPLADSVDPVSDIHRIFDRLLAELTPEQIRLGCPVNNLTQEMSGEDEGFRQRLLTVTQRWRDAVAGALRRGQQNDNVREEIVPEHAADFLIMAFEGFSGMMKIAGTTEGAAGAMHAFRQWIEDLRPAVPLTTESP